MDCRRRDADLRPVVDPLGPTMMPRALATRGWRATAPRLAAALLPLLGPVPSLAQTVVEIDDEIACPGCSIETGSPVTLAAPQDRLWFSSDVALRVAHDREGNYIAAPLEGDALIAAFHPDGSYRSSHGRIGQGPGEFTTNIPLLIDVGAGDTVYAVSPPHLHTLAPRAESGLDQVRIPVLAMGAVVALRDGIAVEATVRTENGVTPVQILRPDGTIRASVGASGSDEISGGPGLRRVLGRSNDHADVWSAHVNRYRLTRYGPDGEEKARVERNSRSFRPGLGLRPGAPYLAPARPGVMSVHQDADGLLWVALSRAPRSFSPLVPNVRGLATGGEVLIPASTDPNRFLHTTVEVLDPVAGKLLARRDFDERVKFVRTPGGEVLVFSLRADELGRFECVVTPLTLQSG